MKFESYDYRKYFAKKLIENTQLSVLFEKAQGSYFFLSIFHCRSKEGVTPMEERIVEVQYNINNLIDVNKEIFVNELFKRSVNHHLYPLMEKFDFCYLGTQAGMITSDTHFIPLWFINDDKLTRHFRNDEAGTFVFLPWLQTMNILEVELRSLFDEKHRYLPMETSINGEHVPFFTKAADIVVSAFQHAYKEHMDQQTATADTPESKNEDSEDRSEDKAKYTIVIDDLDTQRESTRTVLYTNYLFSHSLLLNIRAVLLGTEKSTCGMVRVFSRLEEPVTLDNRNIDLETLIYYVYDYTVTASEDRVEAVNNDLYHLTKEFEKHTSYYDEFLGKLKN